MKMKTQDLTGSALNWAVAKCNGFVPFSAKDNTGERIMIDLGESTMYLQHYRPSTNWSQGGPIIEQEGIAAIPNGRGAWEAELRGGDADDHGYGPTPLIAAMRCYVASKLGESVDVPEELK
jgi:hypothetical protein